MAEHDCRSNCIHSLEPQNGIALQSSGSRYSISPQASCSAVIEVRDYPERDIWSLGVMVQGSSQMGELLGRRRRRRRRRRRHLKIGV